MAEFTKGRENLEEAINTCQEISTTIADAGASEAVKAKSDLQDILSSLHEVGDKFFLKTMMSVPPTKACKTEAAATAKVVAAENWDGLPAAIEKLHKATKTLVTKAKMDGTTIT